MSTKPPPATNEGSPAEASSLWDPTCLRLAIDAAKAGVWTLDLATQKIEWDDRLCALHQVSEATRQNGLFYERWRAHVHPEDLERAEQHIAEAIQGLRPLGMEYRVLLPDGSLRHLQSAGMVQRSPDGRPLRLVGIDRDITEEREQDALLRERAERLELVSDALELGTWSWDLITDQLEWDQRMCDWYEVPDSVRQSGLYYEFWRTRVHPDDLPQAEAAVAAARQSGTRWEGVFRICRRDGSDRTLRGVGIFQRNARGELRRMLGIVTDVTAAVRQEALLQENLIRLKLATDAAQTGVWSWDLHSDQMTWDDRMLELYEVPESVRPTGQFYEAWRSRVHPDDLPRAEASILRSRKNHVSCDEEFRIVRRDGSIRHVRGIGVIQRDAAGRAQRIVGLSRDITDEREREARLRASEEQLRQVTNSAHDGILMLDAAGAITFSNPAAERILGYPAEELLRKNLHFLLSADPTPAGFRAAYAEFLQTDRGRAAGRKLDVSVRRRDGREISLSLSLGAVYYEEGWHAVAVIHDVSERTRLEHERRQWEKNLSELERLESLGLLAGGIAHDFNNLLAGILNAAELIHRRLPAESPEHARVLAIQRTALRATELSQQMLAYSGRAPLALERHSLNALAERAVAALRSALKPPVGVTLHLGADVPPVECDPRQLQQVIENLIANAAEAIGDRGGTITVQTARTETSSPTPLGPGQRDLLAPGTYAGLEVADTGCGMTPEVQARIFDPFFTTRQTGRGLGLSFALGVIRNHRGAIAVQSRPGAGSRFTILLRLAEAPPAPAVQPPPPLPPPAEPPGKACILVVDDDDNVRSTTADILEFEGFEVATAPDGREAVDLFRTNPSRFQLVVMDLTMPRLTGDKAFAELRALNPAVRVILMSGFPSKEVSLRFAGPKPDGYLMKPFPIADLVALVRSVLAKAPEPPP